MTSCVYAPGLSWENRKMQERMTELLREARGGAPKDKPWWGGGMLEALKGSADQ